MPTDKQRRDVTRQQLQRQLELRRARDARRRKTILIASVVATVLVIAGVAIGVGVAVSGGGGHSSGSTSARAAGPCAAPAGATVHYEGVTVSDATTLSSAPKVTSSASSTPTALQCEDLVVGTGRAASPTSTVKVQYTGVLYKNGTEFDSSWTNGGKPVSFPLTRVVAGFTQGIGGNGTVAPMRVGGRRLMILPASLGYGSSGSGKIPANAPLVFVVDLTSVS